MIFIIKTNFNRFTPRRSKEFILIEQQRQVRLKTIKGLLSKYRYKNNVNIKLITEDMT